MPDAEIGVFGGSGFYSFLDDVEEVVVETPWGAPSDAITIGRVAGRSVAFLPRHGRRHEIPPHRVNFRANVWALRELGVRRVFGPCAAGSLQPRHQPGTLVVLDQLVDRTSGRVDTFFDGPRVVHISFGEPYCPELRAVATEAGQGSELTTVDGGTVVVIQGPRFSTRAESVWFRAQGWDVVNMTQHPEAYLCREAGLCYGGMALVTDYDSAVEGVEPVSMAEVLRVFDENISRLRDVLLAAIAAVPVEASCGCGDAAGGLVPVGPGS